MTLKLLEKLCVTVRDTVPYGGGGSVLFLRKSTCRLQNTAAFRRRTRRILISHLSASKRSLCLFVMSLTSLTTLSRNSHLLSESETFQIMASLPKDPPEDPKKLSFWMVRSAFMFIQRLCECEHTAWAAVLTIFPHPSQGIMCARCTERRSHSRPATISWPALQREQRWRNSTPSSSASGAASGSP